MKQQRHLSKAAAGTLVLVLASCGRVAFGAPEPVGDRPDTHNMLVVGEQAVYLSHLPMFQEHGKAPMPHRYQAILEVAFDKQEAYAKDRRKHQTMGIYMLNPEKFVLPDLVPSDPRSEPLRSFKAKTIVRGHLERSGSLAILQDVEVDVKRVVHFRELMLGAEKPDKLHYLLFGRGPELFLAHLIAASPDFDQILAVRVAEAQFNDAELAKGIVVVFPGTRNAPAARLRATERHEGEVTLSSPPVPAKIQVDVTGELYFEEGELRVPPLFAPTLEEERAGFP